MWKGWKSFGHDIGNFQIRILLGIFYFFVVAPFGVAMRLFGKDERQGNWLVSGAGDGKKGSHLLFLPKWLTLRRRNAAVLTDGFSRIPGLGSSSCYAVGLLRALQSMKREYSSLQEVAEMACDLEITRLGKPIGKQDQYMAAFGGLTVLEIDKAGTVRVRAADVTESSLDELNRNILMFYTGTSRSADAILSEQSQGAKEEKKDVVESMHYIKELGYKILEAVESGVMPLCPL